jgi:hypothetical protein
MLPSSMLLQLDRLAYQHDHEQENLPSSNRRLVPRESGKSNQCQQREGCGANTKFTSVNWIGRLRGFRLL